MNRSEQLTSFLRLRNQLIKPRVLASTARNSTHPAFTRTMASNTAQPKVEPEVESTTKSTGAQSLEQEQHSSQHTPLPLPEPTSNTTQLNVNGEGVKLDHLGPLVINKDGTMSRIANWDKMAEIEKQNTLRILGKRNQLRLGNLRGEGNEEGK